MKNTFTTTENADNNPSNGWRKSIFRLEYIVLIEPGSWATQMTRINVRKEPHYIYWQLHDVDDQLSMQFNPIVIKNLESHYPMIRVGPMTGSCRWWELLTIVLHNTAETLLSFPQSDGHDSESPAKCFGSSFVYAPINDWWLLLAPTQNDDSDVSVLVNQSQAWTDPWVTQDHCYDYCRGQDNCGTQ